ncbi:AI-2E family transporter [Haloimpatiens sp. FM7330]|uniref:AI-2E family transporter n=1 Tax=Haloimpatiens sp. FM7330 TaxID=3298610 RepID=UPI003641452F
MKYRNRVFEYGLGIFLFLLILYLIGKMGFIIIFLKQIFSLILIPLLMGILFYYILRPIVNFLEKRHINRGIASIIVTLGIIFVIIMIMIYGGTSLNNNFSKSFNDLFTQFQNATKIINEKFGGIISSIELNKRINSSVQNFWGTFTENITNIFSQIANVGSQIILIPFIIFYFLRDDKNYAKRIIKITPNKYKNAVKNLLLDVDKTLSTYITGQLIVAVVVGVLMYIGYRVIKIPNAFLLSIFVMITNIIPFLGPFLGAIPAVLMALTIDMWMILKVLIVSIIVQQLEGNLITPNILGNKLEIHPLSIILLVFIFISLFGTLGAFIAIPVYAVCKVTIKDIYKIYKVKDIKTK